MSYAMLSRCGCWLLLSFCCLPAQAQYMLRGTVLDSQTRTAIAGASIRLDGSYRAQVSDSSGKFAFLNLSKTQVVLSIQHLSYQPVEQPVVLTDDAISIYMAPRILMAEEVTVTALRAPAAASFAETTLDKKEIESKNLGLDIPYLLQHTPSAVSTSDAGTGFGYTSLRIRGSDASRISVTVNGVPVNDAESQAVYWVDLPDLAGSTENIQVQRGLGNSTNGAGAFGASVNIQTARPSTLPYGTLNTSAGSFGSSKTSVGFGTGSLNRFSFDGRFATIHSDGFVDRSAADLKSLMLGATYHSTKSSFRFLLLAGDEKTGQAWYGVPEAKLRNDHDALLTHYYNNLGALYYTPGDSINLFNSDNRKYNYYTYEEQSDNYRQDNYQLHYALTLSSAWIANAALHYTPGSGYYEEYRHQEKLADYGLSSAVIGNDTITSCDLVRRRWLENDFYGAVYSLQYHSEKLSGVFGGAWNRYEGEHFGEVTWAEIALTAPKDYEYYRNNADKKDFNSYIKVDWNVNGRLQLIGDVQYRRVDYTFSGYDNALQAAPQHVVLNFVNPKAGLTYKLSEKHTLHAYAGLGHKEPMRDDYTDAPANTRPGPETLLDIEAGYRFLNNQFQFGINFYDMLYSDQLVVTGFINDIGLYPRQNVPESFRRGLEVEVALQVTDKVRFAVNTTISQNQIKEYSSYTALYDASYVYTGQEVKTYQNTDIAFSPSFLGSLTAGWMPLKNLELNLIGKFVGKQYLDNTSDPDRMLDPYHVVDFRANYSLPGVVGKRMEFTLGIFNLLNQEYESNGYTYSYIVDTNRITENYYFPQAGTSILAGLTLKF